MDILILGAGITGVLSAYFLGRAGHSVTVIDRQEGAAKECSYANGGQLSYSHAEPWANPYIFPKLAKWFGRDDAPLVFRFSTDPHMIKWGLKFLANCRPSRADANTQTMLRLGLFSRDKMTEIRGDTGIPFDWQNKGILHLFTSEPSFEHAIKQSDYQKSLGCEETILNREECITMEPTLAQTQRSICGGLHAPLDENGDIYRFTKTLAKYCAAKFGTEFLYDTRIDRLEREGNKISAVHTSAGELHADTYVMCLGAYSPLLLRQVELNAPIYPMKGYSLTFAATDELPHTSITDDATKVVYSRLGDRIRVAGTAEFAGYDDSLNAQRAEVIRSAVSSLFPAADMSAASEWACLRPSTPDGPPIVGRTPVSNLFMNTGHGTLGWTQGAGTSALLANVIDGATPEISMKGIGYR